MNKGKIFLGRQPIVDRKSNIIAYELLYRNLHGTSEMSNKRHATANVLTHILSLTGVHGVVGEKLAFINVDSSFLQHDMFLSVPKEQFVFELDETILEDDNNLTRLEELYLEGYSFAFCINDITENSFTVAKKVSKFITYIKLNTIQTNKIDLMKILLSLGSSNKRLIATHIETIELFNNFNEMGFEYFQGYFFAKPEIIESAQVNSDTQSIITLCNLLTTDSPMQDITNAFIHLPAVTVQLIQYLNSCTFSLSEKITSIDRVVTLLGRKALVQWLYLTLYANGKDNIPNEALLTTIIQRTQLIIDIIKTIQPTADRELLAKASFLGLLSAIDVIFKQPLPTILDKLNIDNSIQEALLDKQGFLGEIYDVALSIESFDLTKVETFLREHDIAPENFQKLLFRSFENTDNFKPLS